MDIGAAKTYSAHSQSLLALRLEEELELELLAAQAKPEREPAPEAKKKSKTKAPAATARTYVAPRRPTVRRSQVQPRPLDDPWSCGDVYGEAGDPCNALLDQLEELLEGVEHTVFVEDKSSHQTEDEEWTFRVKGESGQLVPLYGALALAAGLLGGANPYQSVGSTSAFSLVQATYVETRRNFRRLSSLKWVIGSRRETTPSSGRPFSKRKKNSALNLAASSLFSSSMLAARVAARNVTGQLRRAGILRFARRSGLQLGPKADTNPITAALGWAARNF